jgi:hypothetical protein
MATGVEENRRDRLAADRLLAKIRTFVADQLDDREAALFAALVGPGVARAHEDRGELGSDVDWCPDTLPESLVEALRAGGIRADGFNER